MNFESKVTEVREGICIKFKCEKDEKCFINLCYTDEIRGNVEYTRQFLEELMNCQTEQQMLDLKHNLKNRIALSLSECHLEEDNRGFLCRVFDVAMNTNVFQWFIEVKEKSCLFDYFVKNLLFTMVSKKYDININLENDYVILKNKKSLKLKNKQTIRQIPKIEVLEEKATKKVQNAPTSTTEFLCFLDEENKQIVIEILSSNTESSEPSTILISTNQLHFTSKSQKKKTVNLPKLIDRHRCTCGYNPEKDTTTVFAPLLQTK
ncbi:hypothetical protein SNEBB_009408 [Seison nebaliae]|nr:hypothetical protein SNEBB_009408 [Seison nebaliae]